MVLCCCRQGKALNEVASRNCKVMVVGNPCNTNAMIAMENAPNIPRKNFHALTRLDENRAKCQLALKAGKFYTNVSRTCIWGNHSTTQVRQATESNVEHWLYVLYLPAVLCAHSVMPDLLSVDMLFTAGPVLLGCQGLARVLRLSSCPQAKHALLGCSAAQPNWLFDL